MKPISPAGRVKCSEMGSVGGKKAAAKMTPEARRARARKAAYARHGKAMLVVRKYIEAWN